MIIDIKNKTNKQTNKQTKTNKPKNNKATTTTTKTAPFSVTEKTDLVSNDDFFAPYVTLALIYQQMLSILKLQFIFI